MPQVRLRMEGSPPMFQKLWSCMASFSVSKYQLLCPKSARASWGRLGVRELPREVGSLGQAAGHGCSYHGASPADLGDNHEQQLGSRTTHHASRYPSFFAQHASNRWCLSPKVPRIMRSRSDVNE
ncbi:hypothetical protein GGTG_10898 [Gaeumannomyces tritici R3-111a-1]|uniref:Uncharacterized protein n=1 Tax=Gaeumannomyces tritici (strain R3-111a-1) TaxID=644352 RepID=J3PBM6_GAET3|nr:hypothetical protein GGTG_10898 [Gaeumannomyces tritici R3-111a-1]EJT71643.1 hypothetical protein GGTG_10898 [Gaeumannomyces tritici R3-111a-1]